MKKYLIFALVFLVVAVSGCSLFGGDGSAAPPSTVAAADKTGGAGVDTTLQAASYEGADETTVGATAASAPEKTEVADSTTYIRTDAEGPTDAGGTYVAGASTVRIPVTLYYKDTEGYLIPMTRWIDNQQGIARAAVSGLIDSALNREEIQYYGVYPVLPENSDVLGINIRDGVAVVDFNRRVLDYADAVSERDIVASVVYTLTEFKTIHSVRILINGYPQTALKFGTDISGILNRDNIMINSAGGPLSAAVPKADIYCFRKANEGFTYLVPVSMERGAVGGGANPGTLVRLLLLKNNSGPFSSEMPAGATLRGFTLKEGVLTLDFDESFVQYGGNAREDGILKQLMYTVRQVEGISKVMLLVGGKAAELPEGTDVARGMAVPRTINDVIDR